MFKKLKIYSLALACLLMFNFAASAQTPVPAKFVLPEQKLTGSEATVQPGEVVILNVTPVNPAPKYFAGVTYEWVIFEDGKRKVGGFIVFPDKTSVVFGAGVRPGKTFNVLLMACYLYTAYENDDPKTNKIIEVAQRVQMLSHQVKVAGVDPNPPDPPEPGPDPVPTPVFPDGQFKLAKFVYDNAMSKVPAANRKGGPLLAKSFQGQASAVAAGTVKTVEALLKQTTASNQSALNGGNVPVVTWDFFFTILQDRLYELYRAGQLTTPQQYATAWREIAEGLEKVR